MWMLYSQENYPVASDLHSAVTRLCCELEDLEFDALHAQNYDLAYIDDPSYPQQLEEKYRRGRELCRKYLDDKISIIDLYAEFREIDLNYILSDVKRFLPGNLLMLVEQMETEAEERERKAADAASAAAGHATDTTAAQYEEEEEDRK
jgi:hypothetical protein